MEIQIGLLLLGLVVWYFYYGLECFLSGAYSEFSDFTMPFEQWCLELSWNLPIVGDIFRRKFANGDEEWADKLYSPLHFLITCILLPFGPWLIYKAIV